ncbi:hypothetical protein CHUAL_009927 [Chamberlinius hualienensis]
MAFNGKYRLQSSDNFENYMRAIGVPEQLIQAGADSNAETTIQEVNGSYVITLSASGRTITLTFQLGTEFEETTPHGVKVKTVVTKEGNKLIQKQTGPIESVIIREINGDLLTVNLKVGSVISTRTYARV